MNDTEFEKINEARRRKGLPPLTKSQASTAVATAPNRYDAEFDINWLLINLAIRSASDTDKPSPQALDTAISHPSPSSSTPDIGASFSYGDSGSGGSSDSGGG
jgi:hypothetical protein